MATFNEDLLQHLRNSGITNISAYLESFPAPTSTSQNIVGIVSVGEVVNTPELITYTKRFIVTGTSTTSYTKAHEIVNLYFPRSIKPTKLQETALILSNSTIKKVFVEKMPSLVKNVGNIFYADFILRFIVAD